ncbi:hypothetical protein YSY43_20920 [Paenibacillus sp. YSY-4.3]
MASDDFAVHHLGYMYLLVQCVDGRSAPATREVVAVALVKLKGYDANRPPDQSTIEAMFKDYAGISESAKSYVTLAVENGLVSGFQDEKFRPQATVTRAETTVMLWRAYQYGNDNKEKTTPSSSSPTNCICWAEAPKGTLMTMISSLTSRPM